MFTFHEQHADVHFSWDGWMQIKIQPGASLATGLLPDRFDIREPDLRDPSRHPKYPADGSVHVVPETQTAFEALCETWWQGGELCVGLRDYARDPWEIRSWGPTLGSLRYRYTGGTHIEIAPGDIDVWRPLIAIAADDRTPATLSTEWLGQRVDGWEKAWLAAHGILDEAENLHDPIIRWTIANLPAPGPKGSLVGQFDAWISRQVVAEFTGIGDLWRSRVNLGSPRRYVSERRLATTRRRGRDGTRWNFTWNGYPYAIVWSPDRQLHYAENHFAHSCGTREREGALAWLEAKADEWLAEYDQFCRVPASALPER